MTDPEGVPVFEGLCPEEAVIENPRLWWPNGYGSQPLYHVEVELLCDGCVLDSWSKKIGLRTMTIHREKDEYGEQFAHEVNGVRIFAMGADYIPEDNILPRVKPERTYELLKQARDAHFNCIRVWGGGNYPYDGFWDACDELGLFSLGRVTHCPSFTNISISLLPHHRPRQAWWRMRLILSINSSVISCSNSSVRA